MNKLWKFLQYGYLVIAIICLVEGIIKLNSGKDTTTGIILLATAAMVVVLFFVKRKLRKRIETRNQSK